MHFPCEVNYLRWLFFPERFRDQGGLVFRLLFRFEPGDETNVEILLFLRKVTPSQCNSHDHRATVIMLIKSILDLPKREIAFHIGMAGNAGVSISRIMQVCASIQDPESGIARTAVWRRLKQLAQEGLVQLVETPNRKGTYYVPTDALRRAALQEHLSSQSSSRPKVAYDTELIDRYEPNRTFYLSQVDRTSLHTACAPGTWKRGPKVDRDMRKFMSDLSYASSRMEGVDHGHLATTNFFAEDSPIANLPPRDRKVLMNHFQAAKYIVEEDVHITPHDIRSVHAILSNGLLTNPMRQGAMRATQVRIQGSAYIPPTIPMEVKRLFSLVLEKAAAIVDPYEQSHFLLVHLPYLQPFDDCNKRVARLAANIPLMRNGILPISWMDVNQTDMEVGLAAVYEQQDTKLLSEVYVQACHRSFESFEITRTHRDPDDIDLRYDNQLRLSVRKRVLEGGEVTMPAGVDLADATPFIERVHQVVDACLENPFVGAPFGLRLPDIERYSERQQASPHADEGARDTNS